MNYLPYVNVRMGTKSIPRRSYGNTLLLTWNTYVSEEKANGLLPAGEYRFGADGKMIR